MAGGEAEIERIEHELEILRARYALFEKWGRITKVFLATVIPASLILIVVLSVRAIPNDLFFGLFIGGMICVAVGLLWFGVRLGPLCPNSRAQNWRAIDMVSPQPYPSDFFPWNRFFSGPLSEAQEIEDMIAVREKRLAELKLVQT